ncbi:uncharacterized protein LOC125650718 [Ostrea edulis]|uniref:uncharacterized protein LOC125650718 n=1 Tax=Ostrea edulis TaxID=37623 RepID=UPI0024AFECD0|nr:uncharacterized protein LOC125650718 [Ostrea edulis]
MYRQCICLFAVAIICLLVGRGECGECCRLRNILTSDQDETWCSDYCCISLGNTYCCDISAMRAPEEDRLPFCTDWFHAHVWVPIVVSIAIVAMCVGCCVCCCRACCGRRRETIIVQGGQPGGTTVVAQQQSTMLAAPMSPYNAGYNQS